jgi:hypothetical protein
VAVAPRAPTFLGPAFFAPTFLGPAFFAAAFFPAAFLAGAFLVAAAFFAARFLPAAFFAASAVGALRAAGTGARRGVGSACGATAAGSWTSTVGPATASRGTSCGAEEPAVAASGSTMANGSLGPGATDAGGSTASPPGAASVEPTVRSGMVGRTSMGPDHGGE